MQFFPEDDALLKYLGWYPRPLDLEVLTTGLICSCSLLLEAIRCHFNFLESMGKSYLYLLCIPGVLFLMCSLGGEWRYMG